MYLRQGKRSHVFAIAPSLMPLQCLLQSTLELTARMTVQPGTCLAAVQLEVMGFMRLRGIVALPMDALAHLRQTFNDPLYRASVFLQGAKIPRFGKTGTVCVKLLGQHQISGQGFEHMLPGPRG